MSRFRLLWRLPAVALWTAFCYLALLVALVGGALLPRRRTRLRGLVFRGWARGLWRVLAMRVAVRGVPPRAPFFLVSNHLSYVDVLLLGGVLDTLFVAKEDIARWPVIGHLCRMVGTIFVVRERRTDVVRVNRLMSEAFEAGDGVVLFAEGTSTPGVRVETFQAPLLQVPAVTRRSVHYAAVGYRMTAPGPPAHLAVCWWGGMGFLDHLLALLALPGFRASLSFGSRPVGESDRKRLAARLHTSVSELFVPVAAKEDVQCPEEPT